MTLRLRFGVSFTLNLRESFTLKRFGVSFTRNLQSQSPWVSFQQNVVKETLNRCSSSPRSVEKRPKEMSVCECVCVCVCVCAYCDIKFFKERDRRLRFESEEMTLQMQ